MKGQQTHKKTEMQGLQNVKFSNYLDKCTEKHGQHNFKF